MSTKNRTELKAYFKAQEKPTESQFADFIDAGINQAEDGIEKKPGEPLRITAEELEINSKILLNAPSTNISEKESEVVISAEENTLNLSAEEIKLNGNISMNNSSSIDKTLGGNTTSDTVIPSQKAVKNYVDTRLPSGLISMWSGTEIPDGWALCNGENNTPDLRGRFVVGFDKDNPEYNQTKKTGGLKEIQLTIDELPPHTHKDLGHTHNVNDPGHNHNDNDFNGLIRHTGNSTTGGMDTIDKQGKEFELNNYGTIQANKTGVTVNTSEANIENTGGNQSHENRPPYFVLAYIMKL